MNKEIIRINQDPLSKAVAPFGVFGVSAEFDESLEIVLSPRLWHWYGPLASGETVVMVINLSHLYADVLLQWKHIPAFKDSSAKMFKYRDVSQGKGLEGHSSVGVGVNGVAPHGSFVMIVSEMAGGDKFQDVEFADHVYISAG